MAGGCFQKMITFLAAGLLIMMLAVNLSEATLGTDCTSFGDADCNTQGANNEVCTATVCACDTEFTDNAGACDLDCALTIPTDGTLSSAGVTGTYACNTGFVITGTAIQTCSGGTWSESEPTCGLACAAQPSPSNGAVSMSANVATFTCDTGYTVTGSSTLTCATDTVWSGIAPTCPHDCGALTNPTYGTVSIAGVTATYTCATGFTVTGGPTQTCLSPTWGGTAATCVLACTAQITPLNGAVTMSANVATFTCTSGYTLSNSVPMTCKTDTSWTGTTPTCPQVLEGSCTSISDCSSVTNAECTSNLCACASEYRQDGTTCVEKSGGGPGVSNSMVGIIITFILTALAM